MLSFIIRLSLIIELGYTLHCGYLVVLIIWVYVFVYPSIRCPVLAWTKELTDLKSLKPI